MNEKIRRINDFSPYTATRAPRKMRLFPYDNAYILSTTAFWAVLMEKAHRGPSKYQSGTVFVSPNALEGHLLLFEDTGTADFDELYLILKLYYDNFAIFGR